MKLIHKVIVTCRLETGDDIDVSVCSKGKPLTKADLDVLFEKMDRKFSSYSDSVLYYKIRQTNMGVKSNWNKISTLSETKEILVRELV